MEKYAIVMTKQTYHAADQRSIDAPGHGYPAHTTEHQEYREYEDFNEFEDEVIKLTKSNKNFKALQVTYLEVKTTIGIQ